MTEKVQRIYRTKDVDMLIAVSTIIESAIANKAFLQTKRTSWKDPFFEDLQAEINKIIKKYLGVDGAKGLRQSTQVVLGIQADAIRDLAEVKVQLLEDFKDNPTLQHEIQNQLGFITYHKPAQKGDQEALISLLFRFKTNLTETLRAAIEDKGTPAAILDAIISYADTLKDANITQEGTKGSRKEITAEALTEFNLVYSKVIGVAKIASNFFKENPTTQQQFSFNKVAKTMNATKRTTNPLK